MTNAIVLLSALVPTTGHKALLDFARNVADDVYVVINSKSWEPVSGQVRVNVLSNEFSQYPNIHFALLEDDEALEADDGTQAFWDYWYKALIQVWGHSNFDFVVGSESYCRVMAGQLGATFMPFDMNRETTPVKGTLVRQNMIHNWDQILPSFRATIPTFRFVMFGPESTGKTTVGKAVVRLLNRSRVPTKFIPEWARQYLETVGPELTAKRMRNIIVGQAAQESMIEGVNHVAAVLDTDLYSTFGYYGILKDKVDPIYSREDHLGCLHKALEGDGKTSLYFLMPDDFPVTPDPIRYAGDKREGSYAYWKSILDTLNLPYHEVSSGTVKDKTSEVARTIYEYMDHHFDEIASHERRS